MVTKRLLCLWREEIMEYYNFQNVHSYWTKDVLDRQNQLKNYNDLGYHHMMSYDVIWIDFLWFDDSFRNREQTLDAWFPLLLKDFTGFFEFSKLNNLKLQSYLNGTIKCCLRLNPMVSCWNYFLLSYRLEIK